MKIVELGIRRLTNTYRHVGNFILNNFCIHIFSSRHIFRENREKLISGQYRSLERSGETTRLGLNRISIRGSFWAYTYGEKIMSHNFFFLCFIWLDYIVIAALMNLKYPLLHFKTNSPQFYSSPWKSDQPYEVVRKHFEMINGLRHNNFYNVSTPENESSDPSYNESVLDLHNINTNPVSYTHLTLPTIYSV